VLYLVIKIPIGELKLENFACCVLVFLANFRGSTTGRKGKFFGCDSAWKFLQPSPKYKSLLLDRSDGSIWSATARVVFSDQSDQPPTPTVCYLCDILQAYITIDSRLFVSSFIVSNDFRNPPMYMPHTPTRSRQSNIYYPTDEGTCDDFGKSAVLLAIAPVPRCLRISLLLRNSILTPFLTTWRRAVPASRVI